MNYSKLGRGRKKKLKYRKAKGRHNKIRENMKGHPRKVSIGYKKSVKNKAEEIRIISNVKELLGIKKGEKIIIARVGKKKKIGIAKKAKEQGIELLNLNIKRFLRKIEQEEKKKKEAKTGKGKEKKKVEEKKEETTKKTEDEKENKEEKK